MMARDSLCGHWQEQPMNRIREIREAAGLSAKQLGEMVGTSGNQITRLETGERRLTVEWMTRIAEALRVTPADLISRANLAEMSDEVESHADDAVSKAIALKGLRLYRVLGRNVVRVGVIPGETITVDMSDAAVHGLKGLEVVLVEAGTPQQKKLILRQFVPPDMLITNRGDSNIALSLNDPDIRPRIIGVVLV